MKLVEDNDWPECEQCGVKSEDVSWVIEPYIEEMSGEKHWLYMCDDCYGDSVMSI